MPVQPPNSRPILLTEIVAMGGAERSVLALSRWLSAHDLPNHFLTYQDHIGLPSFASHPITVVELRPEMRAIPKISALRRHFAGRPTGSPKPLMSGYQPALHGALAGLRGFHTLMHDTPSLFSDAQTESTFSKRLARRASNHAIGHGLRSGGQTIVTSSYLQAETRRVFGVHAAIARMGGLTAPGSFRLRPVTTSLRMLSVSRIEPNKRISWLIRALAALESRPTPLSAEIDWRLDVAGSGSHLPELQALIAQLSLTHRIHLLGFVPDNDLDRLYDQAHLFLMPAVQGYGIPAIEALSRGIPVLLHRDSGVSDILLETPWATVFTGEEAALTAALSQAIHSTRSGRHLAVPPPNLPTEDSWAEQVANLCGWVTASPHQTSKILP